MLTTHRQRLRLLLSAGSSLLPALAWSQSQSLEPVLMRGSTSVPVANTWYVDEAGNFVLMSDAKHQAIELAQLPTPQVPLQSLTETASSSMQIPPEMLQQVMGWSAAMGGVAGGGLVGSLALTSGMLRGPEGPAGPSGPAGPPGDPASGGGLSAYEVAVDNGFVGSEQDWLNSLVGPTGPTGPQGLAGAAGATGAAGADGQDGEDGSAGSDGSSAYQVWVAAGNSGTEQDFLNSLVGDTGATGDAGSDGKSAYQIWIDAGNTGTYQTFLDSLIGATGATGGTGAAGQDGADGSDGADGNNHPSIFGGSAASVSVSENSTAVFYTATATDPDAGDTPTFTKGTAGGDEGLFTLTSDGKLSFTSAADYENSLSQVGGNTYSVQIISSDGRGGTDTQDVTVNVTDITENSTLELNEADGATFNILQGNTHLFDAFDSEGDTITYSMISNGHGSGVTLNSQTGLLSVASNVAAGSADVRIRASSTNPDQTSETDTETYTINVQDITPPTLTITADDDTLTLNQSTTVSFDFSEDVTGFTSGDISLSGNGSLTDFSGSGDSYSATYTAAASGETDTVSVATGAFADKVGQTNTESSSKNLAVGGLVENYGNYYSAFGAWVVITGTSGRDELTFGDYAAYDGGNLTINGQGGDDVVSFGAYASEGSLVTVSNLSGDQTYNIEMRAGNNSGLFTIETGDGNHDFYFDHTAGNNGGVLITAGDGDQTYDIGDWPGANSGGFLITAGDGDQTYVIGDYAGNSSGTFGIATGSGSSNFAFGDLAARDGGQIDLDLGSDTDADSVSFDGLVGNIFIQNYSVTYDDKVDVVVPSTWSGTDDGTDIVFTQSDQTITFEGLGGAGGSTDPLDYFM